MRFRIALVLLATCLPTGLLAQTVTVGELPANPNFGFNQSPMTAIDLSHPASAAATLTNAAFSWSASPCPGAVKVKFFRPSPTGSLVFVTERGPYDVTSLTSFVFLSPPVEVQAGDLIGIGRLTPCGSPVGQTPGAAAGFVGYSTDVTFTVTIAQGTAIANATISVQASGVVTMPPVSPDPAALVPVVGSTAGALGQAFFRTSVQLHNPGTSAIRGRLVYHPQGFSVSGADPSLFYSLEPGETRSIPDLLPAMGLTGLGTLDVVPEGGTAVPLLAVRVFNDGGSLGTSGFTEEVVLPGDALGAGQRGVLVAPIDTAVYRFNVGVRTLSAGAGLSIVVRNAAGTVTRTLTRTYAPNYFEQRDSGAFLDAVLTASDTITISVVSGSAIVYGATVDNRTNDPSLQLARRIAP
ncbi:MAG: hypothetical protein ABI610_09025 [Acidobacteriota bacterium]